MNKLNEYPILNYQKFAIPAIFECFNRESKNLKMPKPASDGKIPTLNQTGYMTPESDKLSDDFINVAAQWGKKEVASLDVGAAFGIISIPALEKGAILIASDIYKKHLLILRKQTPIKLRNRLFLHVGAFPEQTNFPKDSIGAICLRRIMHFLKPQQLEIGLDKIYDWLVPGGSAFIATMSPYHYSLTGFDEIYEERWNKGNSWPGEIFTMRKYIPECAKDLQDYMHVMDTRPLIKALEKRGFIVKQAFLYGYQRLKSRALDLKGHCAIEVQKPV